MQKSGISPDILDEVLSSAANAAEKGQSQWYTPHDFGLHLAGALPDHRPVVTDLTCGRGDLLRAIANGTTIKLLGSDIQAPSAKRKEEGETHPASRLPLTAIQSDLTLLYPMLVEVDWSADLFGLNPPFGLEWYLDRLSDLANSDLPSVRIAYQRALGPTAGNLAWEGMKGGPTIDSAVATLMIALDRCTYAGEGFLIGNHATLDRLLFAAGAVFSPVAKHVWARGIVPGNPMTGRIDCNFQHEGDTPYSTEVIYFARDHSTGPQQIVRWSEPWTTRPRDHETPSPGPVVPLSCSLVVFPIPNRLYRFGSTIRRTTACAETVPFWQAVREELLSRNTQHATRDAIPWNLWLDIPSGTIHAKLSMYQSASKKMDKKKADALKKLDGQNPMQLVLSRATRDDLLRVAQEDGWKVDPDLITAIEEAIRLYHASRAPLYPLPEIQRLGYLDEQDAIECKKSIGPFTAGQKYPLRTVTVAVVRKTKKPNAETGEPEELEYSGRELAFYFDPLDGGMEYCFMERMLKVDKETAVEEGRITADGGREILKKKPMSQRERIEKADNDRRKNGPIDHTLQELCEHFVIPEVPDVATCHPAQYIANLDKLAELEKITERLVLLC